MIQGLSIIRDDKFITIDYFGKRFMRMSEHEHFVFKVWALVFTLFGGQYDLGLKLTERVHLFC